MIESEVKEMGKQTIVTCDSCGTELEQAIAYFEDAIRESDEIIAECSEALQKELMEQKKHFEVALEAMKEKQENLISFH